MIDPAKLFQLSPGQKRRKLALTFGELERDIAGIAEWDLEYDFPAMTRQEYTRAVAKIVLDDPKLPTENHRELERLLETKDFDERRVCNVARNSLLAIIGTFPAEWDLVIAPHAKEQGSPQLRHFFAGTAVYAEDIRSPFNLGSIFRTAEALGLEKVYLSPSCVNPQHPRAIRSAMGCIETLGFSRLAVDDLPEDKHIFVLETGGTPIDQFAFPREGIVIVGSEELGASPEALHKATAGRVSIPMFGLKASLNVGVAFGILAQAWVHYLTSATDAGERVSRF